MLTSAFIRHEIGAINEKWREIQKGSERKGEGLAIFYRLHIHPDLARDHRIIGEAQPAKAKGVKSAFCFLLTRLQSSELFAEAASSSPLALSSANRPSSRRRFP